MMLPVNVCDPDQTSVPVIVPLDVSFNLTGVWRIPAWNRIGVEELYEKMQAGERFTDSPEQENWNVSDYEWQIQVVGRRITNFGVTP